MRNNIVDMIPSIIFICTGITIFFAKKGSVKKIIEEEHKQIQLFVACNPQAYFLKRLKKINKMSNSIPIPKMNAIGKIMHDFVTVK